MDSLSSPLPIRMKIGPSKRSEASEPVLARDAAPRQPRRSLKTIEPVNFFRRLQFSEISGRLKKKSLFRTVPKRLVIPLSVVKDSANEITNGSILLGFTQDGHHLVSYTCSPAVPDDIGNTPSDDGFPGIFKLQWWAFRGSVPLKKVAEVFLFGTHEAPLATMNMSLTLLETPDGGGVVVHGTPAANTAHDDTTGPRLNWITVLRSPIGLSSENAHRIESLSFCYLSQFPFPPFVPSLAYQTTQRSLVLNTGSGLLTIRFRIDHSSIDVPATVESTVPAIAPRRNWQFLTREGDEDDGGSRTVMTEIAPVGPRASSVATPAAPPSSSHEVTAGIFWSVELDLEIVHGAVRWDRLPRAGAGVHLWTVPIESDRTFDAEAYLSHAKRCLPRFHSWSFTDYELIVVQLVDDTDVLFLLAAVFTKPAATRTAAVSSSRTPAGPHRTSPIESVNVCSRVGFLCTLNTATGMVRTLGLLSVPQVISNTTRRTSTLSQDTANVVAQLRRKLSLSVAKPLSVFTNSAVLVGKSLSVLKHPFYPLALCNTSAPANLIL